MPTPADRLNEKDPQPLRPPENFHHEPSTPKRRLPSNTFKKESDDDDAAARTSPRVSPGTRRGVGKGYTRGPSRRKGDTRRRHHVGAGQADRDFSRPPKNHHPSDRRAPPNLPPTCLRHHDLGNHPRRLTAVTNTRPRVRGWDNGNRGSHNAAVREGTASTARHRGSRPDVTTETHQAQTGPARPTSL
jgi:hypothetical protein